MKTTQKYKQQQKILEKYYSYMAEQTPDNVHKLVSLPST